MYNAQELIDNFSYRPNQSLFLMKFLPPILAMLNSHVKLSCFLNINKLIYKTCYNYLHCSVVLNFYRISRRLT